MVILYVVNTYFRGTCSYLLMSLRIDEVCTFTHPINWLIWSLGGLFIGHFWWNDEMNVSNHSSKKVVILCLSVRICYIDLDTNYVAVYIIFRNLKPLRYLSGKNRLNGLVLWKSPNTKIFLSKVDHRIAKPYLFYPSTIFSNFLIMDYHSYIMNWYRMTLNNKLATHTFGWSNFAFGDFYCESYENGLKIREKHLQFHFTTLY